MQSASKKRTPPGQGGDANLTRQHQTTADNTGTLPDTQIIGSNGPKNLHEIPTIDSKILPDAAFVVPKGDIPIGYAHNAPQTYVDTRG